MIVFPNAKINLGLKVLRKRTDGFHDIETIFYPIPLCDILEIVENEIDESKMTSFTPSEEIPIQAIILKSGKKVSFRSSGLKIEGQLEDNLCFRAAQLYDEYFGIPFHILIHLHKIIPMGAGLGGGSSDAAFTLKVINHLSGNKATVDELMHLAGQLGSDCTFFIQNKPAFAEGKGELLTPININISGYSLVVVKPEVHVATAAAFAGIVPVDDSGKLKNNINQPLNTWMHFIDNDFEKSVFKKYPEIAEIKKMMIDHDAIYTAMSGSGSAVFGIFGSAVPSKNVFKKCFYFKKYIETLQQQ